MKIKTYHNPGSLSCWKKQPIHKFLERFIPQGTVCMSSEVYDSASCWVVVSDDDGKILGFSAQRVISKEYYTVIQIMATFLDKKIRGNKFAALLLQGSVFYSAWRKRKFMPIYWCTRTRISAAYAAAARYNKVYPNFDSPEKTKAQYEFAECIAKTVYGRDIELDSETFLMKNSYVGESKFTHLENSERMKNKYHNYFMDLINFDKNEAVFIFSKMKLKALSLYLFGRTWYTGHTILRKISAKKLRVGRNSKLSPQ